MLESLSSLAYGFTIALQPLNLLYSFIGVTMGTLVGVLPGLLRKAASPERTNTGNAKVVQLRKE